MKMIRRPFGKGPAISLFTLGTMRAIESASQMYEIVKEALRIGINHIDTSPSYGASEKLLGLALNELNTENLKPSGDWVITSKILPGISLKEGKEQLQKIISRLGIKRIHNLAIHGINKPEHLEWVLNGQGKELIKWAENKHLIGQIGFSSHGSIELIEKAINSNFFNFCYLHLHLLDQERIPIAKKALKKGLGVIAISPADKGGKLYAPSETLLNQCKPFYPLELAYRFLIAKGITSLTLGASNIDNFNLAKKLSKSNWELTDQEILSINRLNKESKIRLGVDLCGQCRQCLPCTNEVPIPTLLHLRNILIAHDLKEFSKERYNLIGEAGHWWETKDASSCENCGDCLPRCPNNLDIPKLLKETHQLLKGPRRKRLWD